jgi:class 3 adenylate cyclase/alpha-beta hydrolase superfamily lysophospholipase
LSADRQAAAPQALSTGRYPLGETYTVDVEQNLLIEQPPETRFVKTAGCHVAYQVFGDGRPLVFIPGAAHHLELRWEEPGTAAVWRRQAEFCRTAVFDRRGCGLSDRSATLPAIEEQVDDVIAVMDAAEMSEAVVAGYLDGGWLAMHTAVRYPSRVERLVLEATPPRVLQTADFQDGFSSAAWVELSDAIDRASTDELVALFAPSRVGDRRYTNWFGRYWRSGAGPGGIRALMDLAAHVDVRDLARKIRQPTLVLHREGDLLVSVESARLLASLIPNSRFVVLPGSDNAIPAGDSERWLDALEEFVTGKLARRRGGRSLATVLFTDIVDSTRQALGMGDRRWREELEAHDAITAHVVDAHEGRVVRSTGDGILALFSDPFDAVKCALRLVASMKDVGLEIRAGLHTGQVERRDDDITGIALNVAARISALAGAGEVLVSGTIRDLVAGSELQFLDRGSHTLKGFDDPWRVFQVSGD